MSLDESFDLSRKALHPARSPMAALPFFSAIL